ncbi:hypothetical protein DERF_008169 [Dermatophagoides farinae]|uniref:Uncharacterized protein n=1 Tax=Dermatophagoides farinae TaxID=6954 RepID=A0A922L4G3_DERFA|nr:hypothetical protein DERF_008169 [Dermatophagoides farinae]
MCICLFLEHEGVRSATNGGHLRYAIQKSHGASMNNMFMCMCIVQDLQPMAAIYGMPSRKAMAHQ